jgi:hypothetical protein
MNEDYTKWIGRVVSFYHSKGSVIGCIPISGAKRFSGEVIGVQCGPETEGSLPELMLTVRGRTGKTTTVELVNNYVQFHATFQDADKSP